MTLTTVLVVAAGFAMETGLEVAAGLIFGDGLTVGVGFTAAAGVMLASVFVPGDLIEAVAGLVDFADDLSPFVACFITFPAGLAASVGVFLTFVTFLSPPKPGIAASNDIPTAVARLRYHSRFMSD
ncbi:MAG TPA: hypothetical protein VMR25_04105 [Planctomycetaceae bacterium]|nr:hypothetical protein [Planctomycetaceae bacterium]